MVYAVVTIFAVTCLVMIASVLFFPHLPLGKLRPGTYWVVTLAGAIIILAVTRKDPGEVWAELTAPRAVNPIKILVLFISMTVLSIFLDEMGFFRYLASVTLRRAGKSQARLFVALYIIVSVLTVFTSNDIIVLAFTPFICYFAKSANVDPVPYLAAEFVAANTWSLALIIGNPTNIYLAGTYGIDFAEYFCVSALPTLAAGAVALIMLFLLFRRRLAKPIEGEAAEVVIRDKFLLAVGIVHLAACTVLLAISSYIGLEMWAVSLGAVVSLFAVVLVTSLVRRSRPRKLLRCVGRAPFPLVPFVLSMFVMILALDDCGVTAAMGRFLGGGGEIWSYGAFSFLFSNVVNNIPMSVLFGSVITAAGAGRGAVYATIVGSNLGAFLTPIGALAGIMFGSIAAQHGVKFGYRDFLEIGVVVAVPSLAAALGTLCLVL